MPPASLLCSEYFQFSLEMFLWKKWWITFQIMEQYNNIEDAQENEKKEREQIIIFDDFLFSFSPYIVLWCSNWTKTD